MGPFFSTAMWDQWSPNCAMALQSMVPALVHKSVQLCIFALCCEHNIRAIAMGYEYKRYRWEWWYLPLNCWLDGLGLGALSEYRHLRARVSKT